VVSSRTKRQSEKQHDGLCIDEKLLPLLLRVSGNSGCNRFMEGKPAKAAGSSKAPPEAKPTR
jgi:hypothetical protein